MIIAGHQFFYLGLSLMLVHEMDAIRCKEWRIFPGLSHLDDKRGSLVFIIAHVPLLIILFYGLNSNINEKLVLGLNYFFIFHFGLHLFFLNHKNNEFKDWVSWSIIIGVAMFGLCDILLV